MGDRTLGRLKKVELRTVWKSEETGFTSWLALPENLEVLGDTLGLDLELQKQEKRVGQFRADILCKDKDKDTLVLIENQLARTDHTHLGQLLTYAAGLKAVTIVWLAKPPFRDEHRAALDWLNEYHRRGLPFLRAGDRVMENRRFSRHAEVQHCFETERRVAIREAKHSSD